MMNLKLNGFGWCVGLMGTVQFCISGDVQIVLEPSGNTIGVDVDLESFYTDSEGHQEPIE